MLSPPPGISPTSRIPALRARSQQQVRDEVAGGRECRPSGDQRDPVRVGMRDHLDRLAERSERVVVAAAVVAEVDDGRGGPGPRRQRLDRVRELIDPAAAARRAPRCSRRRTRPEPLSSRTRRLGHGGGDSAAVLVGRQASRVPDRHRPRRSSPGTPRWGAARESPRGSIRRAIRRSARIARLDEPKFLDHLGEQQVGRQVAPEVGGVVGRDERFNGRDGVRDEPPTAVSRAPIRSAYGSRAATTRKPSGKSHSHTGHAWSSHSAGPSPTPRNGRRDRDDPSDP